MAWQLTDYSLWALGAAAVSAAVVALAWRHRSEPYARQFMALMATLCGWSLVYAVQLGFTDLAGQILWQRIALAVGGTVPVAWLLFTIRYSDLEGWLTRRTRALLALDPLLFALFLFTNPYHRLVWTDPALVGPTGRQVLAFSFEIGYYVHISYAYLLVGVGIGLLVDVYRRASSLYRKQTGLLILGTLPPFAANMAYTLGLPYGPLPALDLTPFAFVITGALFGLALFAFDLLERAPVARQRVLDEMGDGLVVLDAEKTVVEVNAVAEAALDPAPDVGTPLSALDVQGSSDGARSLSALDGRTISGSVDGRNRWYDLDCSTLTDHHGSAAGHVIALRDVTERREYEERLEVAQRVLRHNLRNDVNVIRGWAEHIEETATNGHTEGARRILDTADDLIDLSEKTKTMVGMDRYATDRRTTVDVRDCLTTVVAEFRSEYPDATVECECPAVDIVLPDEAFLDVAVRNLVENALEHNDAAEPWARVRVETGQDRLRVHVEDNGPEVPAMEREALREGDERPLQHGSGLGLWIVHWCLSALGGDIAFDARNPRGNVVTLEYPAPEHRVRT